MSLIGNAKAMRKEFLSQQMALVRLKGGNPTGFVPGERWRNNVLYLAGDPVTDSNGFKWNAKIDNLGKPPANNPDHWERDESTSVYPAWANDDVGTLYYNGIDGVHPQSLRRNNSKNWKCVVNHQKTAGNGPRVGSAEWEEVL